MGIARGWEKRVIRTNITYAKRLSPVSLSVFSIIPDLLFDCSRVLEYAKIRTVLQSNIERDESRHLLFPSETVSPRTDTAC